MRRPILSIAITASVLLLASCGGGADNNKATETQMDDLESLEGTISDDMINLDEATDEAPVDPAPGAVAPKKSDDPEPKLDPAEAKETSSPDAVKTEPEPTAE